MNPKSWLLAASIAQVLEAVVLTIAIVFTIVQLKEMTRSRHLEAISKIFEEMRPSAPIEKLTLFSSGKEIRYRSCTKQQREMIDRRIYAYNRVSFLIEKKLVPENLVLELWSGGVRNSWKRLESYVIDRRNASGLKDWGSQFERLAAKSKDYRAKAFGEDR